jgi:hypothetical protein
MTVLYCALLLFFAFLSRFLSTEGSYSRRCANAPSVGKTDILVSGGVLTGVMVWAALSGALEGAAREEVVAFIVSYECFADRGLGGLPGGDESELVKGVRAWKDMGWPARDIAESAGQEAQWVKYV